MKKNWLLLMALCLFTLSFVSCNKKKDAKKEIIIAIIPKLDNEIFDQVKVSAMEAGAELGIVVTWEAPTSVDGKKQKELIENLIKYKVDGILISCNDADALKESITKAINAGIKVGTFDSDAPNSARLFYIGTDNKKAGRVCAETMLKLYEKSDQKPSQIIVLSGGMSANNMVERLSGFKTIFSNNDISVVLNSYEIPEYGKELLTYYLTHNKRVNGVQMLWGAPIRNGVDSIPELDKFIKNGGVSVFFDVSRPILKYIKNNANCATLKQDFHAMGNEGVKNLYKAIKGEPYKSKILYDVTVIDQDNAEAELQKL